MGNLANSDPNAMSERALSHHGLQLLLKPKQSSGTELYHCVRFLTGSITSM